jgi:hypothetical protein
MAATPGMIPALFRRIDLDPVRQSFHLCLRFLPMVAALAGAAAVGRALQLGAAGEISRGTHLLLEVLVEGARVALLLYLIGRGSMAAGWAGLRGMFHRDGWQTIGPAFRLRWRDLVANLLVFALLAAAANAVVFAVARNWTALAMLQHCGWIAEQAGEWVTILFLKNLSVIPWTLAFAVSLAHWLPFRPAQPGP